MAVFSEDAKVYADLIRDKNRLKAQIASGAMVAYQIKKDDSGRVYVYDWMPVVRIRTLKADTWIWDHPSQGIWDLCNWDASSIGSFGRWVDIIRKRWEWSRKQDFKQVIVETTLTSPAIELNATMNNYYLRPETIE